MTIRFSRSLEKCVISAFHCILKRTGRHRNYDVKNINCNNNNNNEINIESRKDDDFYAGDDDGVVKERPRTIVRFFFRFFFVRAPPRTSTSLNAFPDTFGFVGRCKKHSETPLPPLSFTCPGIHYYRRHS